MTTGIDALFCSVCSGYVHPFLDACPTCGSPRDSRYAEALRGESLGLASLPGDPDLREHATARARANTLVTSRGFPVMGGAPREGADEAADVSGLLNDVSGRFQYRIWLDTSDGARPDEPPARRDRRGPEPQGHPDPLEARLRADADRLLLDPVRGGQPIELALATIRSVGTVRGADAVGRPMMDVQPPRGAEILLTAATPDGPRIICIGNPAGLFATKARSDHFDILAWWLGVAAGVGAERRWMAVGASRHAAELGLRVAGSGGPDAAVAGSAGPVGADALGPAIEALDRLRDAGVLTPTEYEAKLRDLRSRVVGPGSPRDPA